MAGAEDAAEEDEEDLEDDEVIRSLSTSGLNPVVTEYEKLVQVPARHRGGGEHEGGHPHGHGNRRAGARARARGAPFRPGARA